MGYDWLESYCLTKKGAVKQYKEAWDANLYLVGEKMFLLEGKDKDNNSIITLKLDPIYGESMRNQFKENVKPGYYMNKIHWNSIREEGDVPDDLLKDWIHQSDTLIFRSLTKKKQGDILNE